MAAIKHQLQAQANDNDNRFTKLETDLVAVNDGLKVSLETALREQSTALIATFERLINQSPKHAGKDDARTRSRSPAR